MKSIILCEGITDRTLLQYYLEKVYHWEYERTESGFLQERTSAKEEYVPAFDYKPKAE